MRSHPDFDLVVLDLDGTIFEPAADPCIHPRVVEVVAAVQHAGVPVTLATGRTLEFVQPLARLLGLRLPVVTSQGAVVGRADTGEVLYEAPLPLATSREILRWSASTEHLVVLYARDEAGRSRVLQNREMDDPREADRLFGTGREVGDPTLRGGYEDLHLVKFIVLSPPDRPDASPPLRKRFGDAVHFARTHEILVEGTRPGVDKGSGVRWLLEHLGLTRERLLAVGDNENDLPLFRLAGTAVAMATAPPEVREAASWVAPPITEAGAAVALERYILLHGA